MTSTSPWTLQGLVEPIVTRASELEPPHDPLSWIVHDVIAQLVESVLLKNEFQVVNPALGVAAAPETPSW